METSIPCHHCGAPLPVLGEACLRCGTPIPRPPRNDGSRLLALGAALLLVVVATVAGIVVATSLAPPGDPRTAGGSVRVLPTSRATMTPRPSSLRGSAVATPEPTETPTEAARLDGNPWYIEHEVQSSTHPNSEPGDLLVRIYSVEYGCDDPPCHANFSSDDPDTIAPATDNPFSYKDGAYVATETYRDRCVTASGRVYRRGYRVELTTTIRVTEAAEQDGVLSATGLAGSQVRVARGSGVPAGACPEWRIEYATTGSRNVRPGIATDFVSENWAGYIAEPKAGRVTHVEGSWRQPAIACPDFRDRFASFWIGIDGFQSETVEQLGTVARCFMGEPSYAAWWEMYPDPAVEWDIAVRPGDEVHATIDAAGGRFTMTLRNLTTGEDRTTTQTAPDVERSSAEWIAEPPLVCYEEGCELANLSDFGRVRFDDAFASIDGGPPIPMTDPAWRLARDNIATSEGERAAETSTLSSDGTSFTVNWRATR